MLRRPVEPKAWADSWPCTSSSGAKPGYCSGCIGPAPAGHDASRRHDRQPSSGYRPSEGIDGPGGHAAAVRTCGCCSSAARNAAPARWQLPAALPTVEWSCGLQWGAGLYSGHSGTILRRGYGQVLEHFLCPSGHCDLLRSGPDRLDLGRAQIWPQRFQPQPQPPVQPSLIWLSHE